MKASISGESALQQLDQALTNERDALLNHDVLALINASEHKLHALKALEVHPPVKQAHYLRELADRNRANGLLLTQRRREVDWALRYLGRSENTAYNVNGQRQWKVIAKPLAVV